MAVVPDLEMIPPHAHEENWLDSDIPAIGAIYRLQPEQADSTDENTLLSVRELSEKLSFDHVWRWLEICRDNHGNACMQRTSNEPILRGFRLIDCTKHPPVVEEKPWGTTYAALSYVWGSKPEDAKDWPETVLDAVEATRELGLQYLWVDRLCINQSDLAERAYLISRMTTIYEEAQFTVVAAAGSGASHGLPGVRSTPRIPQPKYYLDSGNLLLSTLPDPRRDILESPYWTRGWTYQEGVLSNRHVVFTDTQVYWECRCMATHETADMTLFHMFASTEENSDSVMADFMLSGIFKGATYSGGSNGNQDDLVIAKDEVYRVDHGFPTHQEVTVRSQLRGLNEHIREFSRRNLSRDTDTLFAFQGIVGLYEQTTSLYLFHGIPMWVGDITGNVAGARVTFALSISSWYNRSGSLPLMFVSEPCQRKTHLPSWTWAGWRGTVSWRAPPNLEHCAYMSDLIKATSEPLVWAADILLHKADWSSSICLQNTHSAASLASEALTLIEIKVPFILNTWERSTSHSCNWDTKWYRIGRRLAFIGMSVEMTAAQWTAKHTSGELISVLIFAGKYLDSEHGTARYLTLRKVASTPERWERIGTLYLIIPFLIGKLNTQDLFKKIPGRAQNRTIIIQ
ncbi:HET-domain-containing protein [Cucurbitaria berberidis CBS 394.84]|uniref:HET-domain-containing protein n=1 Tax=Cucurbitaria berberidis CBS 394.84 TaxID=1168544 RepID=A0A9P4LDW6_9PLEO|nr:HET-domain-containing protein [Cucurbitaria berberidis CBS 394.84]KAF1851243.1 HET-domain-containing protein [Cucurbitaria berberidis CBS 394.84]